MELQTTKSSIFYFSGTFKDGGKKARYEVYRFWAKFLRYRQTAYKKRGRFDFHESIKCYLRNTAKGVIVHDDPLPDIIEVHPDSSVKFVVTHLNEVF